MRNKHQEAQDAMRCEQIADSCLVIKRHVSFVGAALAEINSLPGHFTPVCVSELEETESVLRRALAKIEQAQVALAEKPRRAA